MNRFAKALVLALLLLTMPMSFFGQTARGNTIKIELSSISNPDYRYCLLYYIANYENISYVIDEEESAVL